MPSDLLKLLLRPFYPFPPFFPMMMLIAIERSGERDDGEGGRGTEKRKEEEGELSSSFLHYWERPSGEFLSLPLSSLLPPLSNGSTVGKIFGTNFFSSLSDFLPFPVGGRKREERGSPPPPSKEEWAEQKNGIGAHIRFPLSPHSRFSGRAKKSFPIRRNWDFSFLPFHFFLRKREKVFPFYFCLIFRISAFRKFPSK